MLTLGTRSAVFRVESGLPERSLVRISTDRERPYGLRRREAFLLDGGDVPDGFLIYISTRVGFADQQRLDGKNLISLPDTFGYLGGGDILRLVPNRGEVRTLFRRTASTNTFLLTERCNNYCLMCSQPPRQIDDSWLIDEIIEVLHLIDYEVAEIGFSGGEPTLLGGRFLELVATAKALLPDTALHVLSNGRTFSDPLFAASLGAIKHPDLMIGIPLYSDVSEIHDYVVQADGAYDETVRGILNLKAAGVRTELRVVLHKQTVSGLTELAAFIARNLVFVEQVALMGLEITGFTKINMSELWLDPMDYMEQLTGAVRILDRAKIKTMIFNLQLCLLPENIRRFARQSISDWKQEYRKECTMCAMKDQCGGFFAWNVSNLSRGVKAFPIAVKYK